MTLFVERRKYQRCNRTVCKARLSKDSRRWGDIELCDISAGGLMFASNSTYEINTPIQLQLTVYNMLSEFVMKLEGHIIREQREKDRFSYSVKFDSINKYNQVQLDEVIKSKITVRNSKQPVAEDGIYTFLFIPRVKPASFRSKMRMLR
jgi:c-di-GMP-binding flagellar brake protein YcgR